MTASTFRKFARFQDEMTRAMIPRVSAADPVVRAETVPARVRWTLGRRFETKAGFTLGEALRAA